MTTAAISPATMTSMAKYELGRAVTIRPCCRRAEVSAMLRLAGRMEPVTGGLAIEAELDAMASARRLEAGIAGVFGHHAELLALPAGRCLVRVGDGRAGRDLARRAGLISADGRQVSGLPRQVVAGAACDCEAAWRGAFLVAGSLIQAGRSMAIEVTCPEFAAALALAGSARRLNVDARTREARGADRVVIRNSEAAGCMLTRIGAPEAAVACQAPRPPSARYKAMSDRAANIEGANQRRCEAAAELAAARAERALAILGQDAPAELAAAGGLRIEHRRLSLPELALLASPPLTKDTLAGRIRRLLAMADRRAEEAGIPDTYADRDSGPACTPGGRVHDRPSRQPTGCGSARCQGDVNP